jgi:hypothetical protein
VESNSVTLRTRQAGPMGTFGVEEAEAALISAVAANKELHEVLEPRVAPEAAEAK